MSLLDEFEIEADRVEADRVEADRVEADRAEAGRGSMQSAATPNLQGERFEQRRFTGGDTLEEPVLTTLVRDLRASGAMLRATILNQPMASPSWDLWGPLVFSLFLSLVLSFESSASSSRVFSSVFAIIWLGQALVVLNIRMLGGTISYLHALSVSGYCLFPLALVAVLGLVVRVALVRLLLAVLATSWATYCASGVLSSSGVIASRVVLATYPVGLFYFVLGWMCVVV